MPAVADSLLTLPARLGVRAARSIFTTTRDLSQQALGIVDMVGQLVETPALPAAAWDETETVYEAEVVEEITRRPPR